MDICGYTKKPTDEELKKGTVIGDCDWLHSDYELKDKEYTKFIYEVDYSFSSGVTYLVIKVRMYSEFKYLSVLVSPYKERQRMIMKAIEYDEEFIIEGETLSNTDKNFLFNTESKNGNGESMTIKLHKDDINDFMINLVGIKSFEDIQNQKFTDMRQFMSPNETKDDGDYKIYKYPYTQLSTETKILYIMVVSIDNVELKYFSFTLNSTGGLSGGIIALIVILSIIVVLIVAYFVLRKLGIISISIFTCFKK